MSTADDKRKELSERSSSEKLIEVKNLKTYYDAGGVFSSPPVKAVDDVTFEINKGETLGLVGESGCGKTTLGRTLVGLESPTAGEIRYKGTELTEAGGSEGTGSNIQMVFQDPQSSLNDRMTIGEIIREPLDVHGWKSPKARRHRVRELLRTVGLQPEHYFRYPHQFSGGQRQRIGIARALTLEPEFVVLDEPVSALDVSVQAQILNLLADLQDQFGLTYLFIAHDLSVVEYLCDRVAVMYLGHVMEIAKTAEVFQDPKNPYTQALLSAIPEPDPTYEKDRITLQGTPPSPRYPPSGCPFSTRCPSKIRPDEYSNLSEEAWHAIEELREIIRERIHIERTIYEQTREVVGLSTQYTQIEEINQEVFADIEMPDAAQKHIGDTLAYIENGKLEQAQNHLTEEFGSVCDTEKPEMHTLSTTSEIGQSYCHRHNDSYTDPQQVMSITDD